MLLRSPKNLRDEQRVRSVVCVCQWVNSAYERFSVALKEAQNEPVDLKVVG